MIKALWETSRFQILHLLSPHIKKGKNLRSTDIATFPWETTKPVDKEKIEKQIERAKYLAEKWKDKKK